MFFYIYNNKFIPITFKKTYEFKLAQKPQSLHPFRAQNLLMVIIPWQYYNIHWTPTSASEHKNFLNNRSKIQSTFPFDRDQRQSSVYFPWYWRYTGHIGIFVVRAGWPTGKGEEIDCCGGTEGAEGCEMGLCVQGASKFESTWRGGAEEEDDAGEIPGREPWFRFQ